MNHGVLYIVATPIGNLEDITLRGLRVLSEVDLIFCEDTRVSKKLLSHYNINKKPLRLDANTERKKTEEVLDLLKEGKDIAFITDAGTPAISDPGAFLVREARREGITVVAIPGANAITVALSISGLDAKEFVFLGFPPHKKGRAKFFDSAVEEVKRERAVVFYESSHRILKTLLALKEKLGEDKNVLLFHELTKIHEEVIEESVKNLIDKVKEQSGLQKGEYVVILSQF